jgi:hypothetical protein
MLDPGDPFDVKSWHFVTTQLAEKSLALVSKSEPKLKLMPLAVMKPYEKTPDHLKLSIWLIWFMLQCDAGSWWPIWCHKSCHFFTTRGWKVAGTYVSKSEPKLKLMPLAVMKPYEKTPDHLKLSIWFIW